MRLNEASLLRVSSRGGLLGFPLLSSGIRGSRRDIVVCGILMRSLPFSKFCFAKAMVPCFESILGRCTTFGSGCCSSSSSSTPLNEKSCDPRPLISLSNSPSNIASAQR
eukprot:TRINITY_DN3482_c0_g2_i2.p1 TRINITY_DN3482_c0_g2~~TRINITY_DN3482_c0_g2_i2.p1  ORF type:complete len:109 (-),score=4.79 TRINITY_DN3482_c0_g2_i2:212-538(-)